MRTWRRWQRQDGVVVMWTALFLLVLLAFVALAIDVAKLAATRTELQNAADAAALAGASGVDKATGAIVQDTAVVRARFTASKNLAFEGAPTPVNIEASDVTFPTPKQVRVQVARSTANGAPLITHVAQVVGLTRLNVRAEATAEVHIPSSVCEGLVPVAPVQPPNGGWFSTDCESVYVLKQGSGGAQQGNYQLIDLPPCEEGPCATGGSGGASEIHCIVENGYGCCLSIGDEFVLTSPGNKVGPVRDGLQFRWDGDTDRRSGICYSGYGGNGNRIIKTPVIESFDVNGKKYVRIKGFAAFFLRQRPTGANGEPIVGNFIFDVAPGEGDGGQGNLLSIRLVK